MIIFQSEIGDSKKGHFAGRGSRAASDSVPLGLMRNKGRACSKVSLRRRLGGNNERIPVKIDPTDHFLIKSL